MRHNLLLLGFVNLVGVFVQINRKDILRDREITSFILMRMRDYKVSGHSFSNFLQLVRACQKDIDQQIQVPDGFELIFKEKDFSALYQQAQTLTDNKYLLLFLRKYICDLDPRIDFRALDNSTASCISYTPWYSFPNSFVEIANLKFLIYEGKIVMNTGHLMNASSAKIAIEKFLNAGHHISKLKFLTSSLEKIEDDSLSNFSDTSMECYPICLDCDYLTGLSIKDELKAFKNELKEHGYDDMFDLDEAKFNNPIFKAAVKRVNQFQTSIEAHITSILSNATPAEKPLFFMSLGGVGSGKSKLEEFVKVASNYNYVMFSVDNARTYSNIYSLLVKCNQHDDDYIILKEFAYMLFEKLSSEAMNKNINFFRDSSGIPYVGKNQKIVSNFKNAGFYTYCLVAASALYIDESRSDIIDPVHNRIISRFHKKGRAVPWHITVNKHINHPIAQSDACLDCNLDSIVIFDTMVPKGHTHTIAESYLIDEETYNTLHNSFDITKDLIAMGYLPFKTDHCGEFNYRDVSIIFLDVPCAFKRMLVLIDYQKYVDIIQKSLLNYDARGYEELIINTMPWHIPSLDFPFDSRGSDNNYILALAKDVQE